MLETKYDGAKLFELKSFIVMTIVLLVLGTISTNVLYHKSHGIFLHVSYVTINITPALSEY